MSEYQYYEFLAIDRPLTPDEQQAVARLSSRVDPHPRRAIFTYSWSDFPGRVEEVLAKYYDAMIYMANWGSRQLMLRFPKALIDPAQIQAFIPPFDFEECVSLSTVGEFAILNIEFNEETGGDWIEGEGWLDRLAPLRADLLNGDYRALYLVWLKVLDLEDVPETTPEPPVPPGLGQLTPALESLVDLFEIDPSMIRAAAQASALPNTMSSAWMRLAIARLGREECDAFLLQLAQGEPNVSASLNRRLRDLAGAQTPAIQKPPRTVGELRALAKERAAQERQRRAQEAERKRIAELEAFAQRESQAWAEVESLIERAAGNAYKDAVALLVKLRELAIHKGQEMAFEARLNWIYTQYGRRTALMRRLRDAGLHPV